MWTALSCTAKIIDYDKWESNFQPRLDLGNCIPTIVYMYIEIIVLYIVSLRFVSVLIMTCQEMGGHAQKNLIIFLSI